MYYPDLKAVLAKESCLRFVLGERDYDFSTEDLNHAEVIYFAFGDPKVFQFVVGKAKNIRLVQVGLQ